MNDIATFKLPLVKDAIKTLDESVAVLEESAKDHARRAVRKAGEPTTRERDMQSEIVSLKTEISSLKQVAGEISERLDSTIDDIEELVEE